MTQLKLFLFHFHGHITIVRAASEPEALDEISKRYPFDRSMLRRSLMELTTGPEKLIGGGYREPYVGIIYDQKELEEWEAGESSWPI